MNPLTNDSRGRLFFLVSLGALFALTVLVYWPGLSGGFIFDDLHAVSENPAIAIDSLSWDSLRQAATTFTGGLSGREVPMATFAIDHFFWQDDPFGYKLTGLMVHLLNALLVFFLARRIVALDPVIADRPWPAWAALVIALIWSLHPLQVSTVLYVVQRMETLALLFILLGLLAYIEGRRRQIQGMKHGWVWIGVSAAAMVPGYLSKETAVLLPLFAVTLEWAVLRFRAHGAAESRMLKVAFSAILFVGLIVFAVIFLPRYLDPSTFVNREFTAYERFLSQLRALPLYLSWIVWPDPQRYLFFYDSFQHSTGWLNPVTTLLGGMFLLGLAITAIMARRVMPLFSLGIAWFLCSHALTSNVFNLELVFEHRNYFALFGVVLALAALLRWVAWRYQQVAGRTLAAVAVVGLAGVTLVHAATWGDPLNLAMDLKDKNPTSARAGYQLAQEFYRMSDGYPGTPFFSFAEAEFERIRHFDNASPMSERVLIGMRVIAGEPVEDELWQGLLEKLHAQAIGSEHVKAVLDLLNMHNRGAALDEEHLMDAGLILLKSGRMYPYNFYEFGLLALEGLEDEALATRVMLAAFDLAQDESWNRQVFDVLSGRGHDEFVSRLERRWSDSSDEAPADLQDL